MSKDEIIPVDAGGTITARVVSPTESARATVIINSAVGVRAEYYGAFADYAASRGFRAVTYDYRGIGRSNVPFAGDESLGMLDWAQQDFGAVLKWSHATSRLPVVVVGHSFGGQALGLLEAAPRVSAAVLVAAQSGYWRHWPLQHRYVMAALWYLAIPVSVAMVAKFPGKWFKMGETLPGSVAKQWARWGRAPQFFVGLDGSPLPQTFSDLVCPLLSFEFEDDFFAPREAVSDLLCRFDGCALERVRKSPAALGVPVVGHFGFFRKRFKDSLWRQAVDFLIKHTSLD